MQEAEAYVREKFAEYYRDNVGGLKPPPEMEKREFGFLSFEQGIMIRHRAFKTPTDLQAFIKTTVPAHVYNSTAYYVEPEKEMDRKGWLGADLTFDVDADHIATPCKNLHDRWTCKNCGAKGRGSAPMKCPKCRGERIEEEVWLCEICLERAKEEVVKLLDFLSEDFGFSGRDITVCFSGHRGYHAHLRADEARGLNSDERKEIVDYVLGLGFDPNLHMDTREGRADLMEPRKENLGWRDRIHRGMYEVLTQTSEDELVNWGINRRIAKTLFQRRNELASTWIGEQAGPFSSGIGPRTWETITQKAVEKESAKVDTVVTTDIHRLIRVPETLNAKTGLRAAEIDNIESFDPFNDAVVFKGEETVHVREAPQFRVGNQTFGPYVDRVVTLPASAAVFLVAKGKAMPRRS